MTKNVDPNITHPLRMTELLGAVGTLHGSPLTSGTFQAIARKHGIKNTPALCWKSSMGDLVRYSHDAVIFIRRLTSGDVELAKKEYRERSRKKGVAVPATATLPLITGQQTA
jgi:hypothetical protein